MKILNNNGDCCFTVLNGQYRLLSRIDDSNLQALFSQKVAFVFDTLEKDYKNVMINEMPPEIYKHMPMICKEYYGFSEEETDNLVKFLDSGFSGVITDSGIPVENNWIYMELLMMFSMFLQFRKEVMELDEFPGIQFALPESQEREKEFLKEVKTAKEIIENNIGQA